jgi:hypothetical protein
MANSITIIGKSHNIQLTPFGDLAEEGIPDIYYSSCPLYVFKKTRFSYIFH